MAASTACNWSGKSAKPSIDVDRGVECYERLKAKGPTGAAAFTLFVTPLVNALVERATHDQIPLLTGGTGRADAADGRVFPYVFTAPTTWWSQNTAKIRFIGQRAGGMAQLKGLKMAHVYQDNDDWPGKHPHPRPPGRPLWLYGAAPGRQTTGARPEGDLAAGQGGPARLGHPARPGVMTWTALKEAAQVGFPRDKIVGDSASCADQEMLPAGEAAIGFICTTWYGTGTHFPLIQDILTYVYARGKGAGPERDVGTPRWIAGMQRALLTTEALRTAMRHFGRQPLTGAQVQWGLEHLTLTAASLKELGAEGLLAPFSLLVPRS